MVQKFFCDNLVLAIFSAGIALRSVLSLYDYSGYNKPDTIFGDFEAQRHWQEITVNLPVDDWYQNTTDNDLLYWGLDYPPLTAYHSFILGKIAQYVNKSYVELHRSRGITNEDHKRFMRNSVLVLDLLIYIPALLIVCRSVFEKLVARNDPVKLVHGFLPVFWCIAIFYPGQILIDNGHFQYNNVSLGFTALAVAALINDWNLIGSILFVLAVNYKQMELYHALPFFFYLLVSSFKDPVFGFSITRGISKLVKIGGTVISTFVVIWLPWLTGSRNLLAVVHRIFPIDRGVFEDKVSNVWCIVNVFHKIKENYSNPEMAKICLICTLLASVPSIITLMWKTTKTGFLYSLFNVSLAFFLFSFQVHEKTILIPALSAILLFPMDPFMTVWFLQISTFSMLPLLVKDHLLIAFVGLSGAFFFMCLIMQQEVVSWKVVQDKLTVPRWIARMLPYSFVLSTLGEIVLLFCFLLVKPPEKLPFLFPLLISAYSCCHFIAFYLYFNVKQIVCNEKKMKFN